MDNYYEGISGCKNELQFKEFQNLRSIKMFDFENKDLLYRYQMYNKLRKLSQMLKWEGLPDTIPERIMELRIQVNGYMIMHPFEGNEKYKAGIYLSWGTLGGLPDYNYMPTKAIVANPYLNCNKEFEIDKECVVFNNDRLYLGMLPINNYYSTQEVENDISMNALKINARLSALLTAPDDDSYKDITELYDDIKKGKLRSVVTDKNFLKNIEAQPMSSSPTQTIIQLLEERQYLKGSYWNEVGVQSNYNMKRETITSSENILNVDSILPLADDMLEQRQIKAEMANKLFGLKLSVDFGSSWKKIRKEIELKEQEIEDEANIRMSNQMDKQNNSKQGEENKDE